MNFLEAVRELIGVPYVWTGEGLPRFPEGFRVSVRIVDDGEDE